MGSRDPTKSTRCSRARSTIWPVFAARSPTAPPIWAKRCPRRHRAAGRYRVPEETLLEYHRDIHRFLTVRDYAEARAPVGSSRACARFPGWQDRLGPCRNACLCIHSGRGHTIRLTGQDTERGTFSQRHLVLHGVDGSLYTPLTTLPLPRHRLRRTTALCPKRRGRIRIWL